MRPSLSLSDLLCLYNVSLSHHVYQTYDDDDPKNYLSTGNPLCAICPAVRWLTPQNANFKAQGFRDEVYIKEKHELRRAQRDTAHLCDANAANAMSSGWACICCALLLRPASLYGGTRSQPLAFRAVLDSYLQLSTTYRLRRPTRERHGRDW